MKTTSALARRLAKYSLFLLMASIANEAMARANDPAFLYGRTLKNTASVCGSCHSGGTTVTITGASALNKGQASTYTVTATKAGVADGTKMGVAVAASDTPSVLTVVPGMPTVAQSGASDNEIIHASSVGALRTTTGNSATYTFTYTMPAGAATQW